MPVKEATKLPDERMVPVKSDGELLRGCLENREEDWNLLVNKYKNLVYSIPYRYGLSQEEAADIFQSVFLDLIVELPNLRNPNALPKWLMQVTAHRCFHHKRRNKRMVFQEEEPFPETIVLSQVDVTFCELEEEQMLRAAIAGLSPRCRDLIQMIFFEEPKRPYREVAASLGLATGSIGLLRQKCLDCLKKRLEDLGFA
jgi:RNA polymerase sigma factor (sigma-70 family)